MVLRKLWTGAGYFLGSVVDVVYPEICVGCGVPSHQVSWCGRQRLVPGLRPFDRPHLCRQCREALRDRVPVFQERADPRGDTICYAGAGHTSALLTEVVGAWKYHGVRGLAWPLGDILVEVLIAARERGTELGSLVPVPLHPRRRRSRGFNQSAMLAEMVGQRLGVPVTAGVAGRVRRTAQQAAIAGTAARWGNLAGSFVARAPTPGTPAAVTVIDDVVTSGATTGELVRELRRMGWRVGLVASLGLSRQEGNPD